MSIGGSLATYEQHQSSDVSRSLRFVPRIALPTETILLCALSKRRCVRSG